MKQRHAMITCIVALMLLGAGCSTGYRSELVFSHLSGTKYKLNVKVVKVSRTPFATGEAEMCQYNDIIWEQGKPHETTFGNEKSGLFEIHAFVPTDNKQDITYGVQYSKGGDVKLSSNFTIKQEAQ